MKREQLERLDDNALLDEAHRAGVARPEVLTREEQLDAIEAIEERTSGRREGSKGFLSRARGLLADFIERGLNLPQTADRVRAPTDPASTAAGAPPGQGDSGDANSGADDERSGDDGETGSPDVATFTLAQIYVAQGHPERALVVLAQVLRAEPGNSAARRLQARLQGLPIPEGAEDDDADDDDDDDDDLVATLPTGVTPTKTINAPSSSSLSGASGVKPASPAPLAGATASAASEADDEPTSDEATKAVADKAVADKAVVDKAAGLADAEAALAATPAAPAAPAGPPRPAPMLDEIPLPERYGVDELVLMPVDPTTLYLYWEVKPETLAAARRFEPRGLLRLRLEQVLAGGARHLLRTFEVAEVSDRQLSELPAGARCVAELGWDSEAGWRPLVSAQARQLPPAYAVAESARRIVLWREHHTVVLTPPPVDLELADAIREAVATVPAMRAGQPSDPWMPADLGDAPGLEPAPVAAPGWAAALAASDELFAQPAEPWTAGEVDGPFETSERALGSSERLTLRRALRPFGSSERASGSSERMLGASERGQV